MAFQKPFSTTTFGKWILAGEHAVLRGQPALAFPLASRALKLDFAPTSSDVAVHFAGERGADFKFLFHGVFETALKRLGVSEHATGTFTLTSDLPVGAGLGASAALCGAVARWCSAQGWIEDSALYEFACRLEDLFHGESSGVDIAVSLSGEGVRFVRGGPRTPVRPAWRPNLYLSYCGQRGMTSDCVNKVKAGFERDPARAEALDQQMGAAVELCARALTVDAEHGRPQLIEAIRLGRDCFERWGLCAGDLGTHLTTLEAAGAVAVKPTGSGGGGFALSLWDQVPPQDLGLIATAM